MAAYREPGVNVTIQEDRPSPIPEARKLPVAVVGPGFQVEEALWAGTYDTTSCDLPYPNLMSGASVVTNSVKVTIANSADDVSYSILPEFYTAGNDGVTLDAGVYHVLSSGNAGALTNGEVEFYDIDTWSSAINYLSTDILQILSGPSAGPYAIAGFDAATRRLILQDAWSGTTGTTFEWEIRRPLSGGVRLSYHALRTDHVRARAQFLTTDEVVAAAGGKQAIIPENPLFYGAFIAASQRAPVWVVGVEDADGAFNPSLANTAAWLDALEYCQQFTDMYSFAILTQNDTVITYAQTFVDWMSLPENRCECIAGACPARTTLEEAIPSTTGGRFSADGTTFTHSGGYNFISYGCEPMGYIEATLGDTTVKVRVRKVEASVMQVFDADDVPTSMRSPATVSWRYVNKYFTNTEEAQYYAAYGESFQDKRMRLFWPDKIGALVNGVEVSMPGYYWWCERFGRLAALRNPATPFTRTKSSFFTRVFMPFRGRTLLNIIAGGGWELGVQDSVSLPPYCRHQLTTDMTHPARAEQNVVHSIDHCAKYIREVLDKNVGSLGSSALLTNLKSILSGVGIYLVNKIQSLASFKTLKLDYSELDPRLWDVNVRAGARYPVNNLDVILMVS